LSTNSLIYTGRFILIYSSINNILKNRKSIGKINDLYKIPIITSFNILVLFLNITDIVLFDKKFTF